MCHSTQLSLLTERRYPPQGYRQTKQFIVAQSPMHSTTDDFWALVYKKQSPTILLLCPLQENRKVCVCGGGGMCVVLCVYTDSYQHGVCDFSPHATLPQGIETETTLTNCDVSAA